MGRRPAAATRRRDRRAHAARHAHKAAAQPGRELTVAIGDQYGVGQPPAAGFGVQPSGPKVRVGRIDGPGSIVPRHLGLGRAVPAAVARSSSALPAGSTVDYLHKLTSTTVLLIALVAFLVFGPSTVKGKL